MQLTPSEYSLRENVIARVNSLVLEIWPNVKTKVIGSYSYGLVLPTSDIDIMILENSDEVSESHGSFSRLRLLASKINDSNIAETNSIQVRDNLRIPIIEFTDRRSKIDIDIPFYNEATLQVAELLNKYKNEYPAFAKMILVLKQFLYQRNLNDVFNGKRIKNTFN